MKKIVTFGALLALGIALGCVIRTEHRIDAHITLDIRHIDQAENVLDYVEGRRTHCRSGTGANPNRASVP